MTYIVKDEISFLFEVKVLTKNGYWNRRGLMMAHIKMELVASLSCIGMLCMILPEVINYLINTHNTYESY
jgi:hypothetical protein